MAIDLDSLKRTAAQHAIEYVQDGMVVGLGTGSTAEYAVRALAERVAAGLKISGVPTSEKTAALARSLGIPLTNLEDIEQIDITIDGADEVVLTTLHAIKGRGGALLREKIVALATKMPTLIIDESKIVNRLGEHDPVPVEVVTFGWSHTLRALSNLDSTPQLRRNPDGHPFLTDSGNYLLDCYFGSISDPQALATKIKSITGVIEHGLFIGIAHRVIVASVGAIEVIER